MLLSLQDFRDELKAEDILQVQNSLFQRALTDVLKEKAGTAMEELLKLLPPDTNQPMIARSMFVVRSCRMQAM